MALTGALSGGRCYSSQGEANDAFYGLTPPSVSAGSTSFFTQFAKVGGVWKVQRYNVAPDGTISSLSETTAPVMTFPACDPTEQFFDGVTIGWGIAAAIIVAFTFKLMQRAAS